jgi:two-component system NarL family response regulator
MISKIKVLIVDDHPIVRAGVATMLASQDDMHVVGEASDASEAHVMFQSLQPDIVLVDLTLPDMDGIDLIPRLKQYAHTKIVILSARTASDDINRALHAGAQAYLFKDAPPAELLSAIRIVAAGGRFLPPSVGRKADQLPHSFHLTSREREVVLCLARGMGTEKIGGALNISRDTVKTHVRNILGKLAIESRSEAVALCLRAGVVRIEDL